MKPSIFCCPVDESSLLVLELELVPLMALTVADLLLMLVLMVAATLAVISDETQRMAEQGIKTVY